MTSLVRRKILLGLSSAALLAGCGGGKTVAAGKVLVAASIFPLFDIARRVAGDRLELVLVLPPGRSEHGFDPTPKDMAAVAKAKLALSVGLEMDTWIEKLIEGAAGSDVKVLKLGPSLDPRKMTAREVGIVHEKPDDHDHDHHDHDHKGEKKEEKKDPPKKEGKKDEKKGDEKSGQKGHDHGEPHEGHAHHDDHGGHDEHEHKHGGVDPHVWLDPVRMKKAVPLLVEAFKGLDAEGAAKFQANGAEVEKAIDALHADLDARSKKWAKKTIVTFHGAMGYFAERYGLKIAAVVEPFPGKEPTAKYIQDVIEVIGETKAAALFSEPQLDKKPAQVIAEGAKVPLFELDPIGGGPGADTYEKLLLKNAKAFDKALA